MLIFNRLLCISIGVFKINFFEEEQSINYDKYYYLRNLMKQVSEIVLESRTFWYQT